MAYKSDTQLKALFPTSGKPSASDFGDLIDTKVSFTDGGLDTIGVDIINEKTSDTGVTIDGVIIKDTGIGIGTAPTAATKLFLQLQSTGATANVSGDNIVVESTDTFNGMSFLCSNTSITAINFGDTDDNDVAYISYSHANDLMGFRTNGTTAITIDSSQAVTFIGAVNLTGGIIMTDVGALPTSDPTNAGQLWNNGGVVSVSAG